MVRILVVCRVAALARSNESYCLEAATADGASGNDARNDHSTTQIKPLC
jgi:hypothetical protein